MILFFLKITFIIFIIFYTLHFIANFTNFNELGDNFERKKNINSYENIYLYSFITIIFTPFLEELFFRKGLVYSVINSFFLLFGILYTFFLLFFYNINEKNFINNQTFLTGVIISAFLFLLVYIFKTEIKKIYLSFPKQIIIISIFFFAYSHYPMYSNNHNITNILLSPILLIEYIIGGIIFSYIRLKYGFLLGLFTHFFLNFILLYL